MAESFAVSETDTVYASVSSPCIVVSRSDGDEIDVRVVKYGQDGPDIRIQKNGRTVRVEESFVPGVHFHFFGCYGYGQARVEISLPGQFHGELTLETSSGDISVLDANVQELTAGSTSGSVTLREVEAQTLSATSTSGELRLENVQSEDAEFSTTSGSIRGINASTQLLSVGSTSGDVSMDGTFESVTVSTTSGSVHVETESARGFEGGTVSGDISFTCKDGSALERISASTTSGDIAIAVPAGTDMSVDFDSISGELETSAYPGGVRIGAAGDGTIPVTLSTTSGDATIRAAGTSSDTDVRREIAEEDASARSSGARRKTPAAPTAPTPPPVP